MKSEICAPQCDLCSHPPLRDVWEQTQRVTEEPARTADVATLESDPRKAPQDVGYCGRVPERTVRVERLLQVRLRPLRLRGRCSSPD